MKHFLGSIVLLLFISVSGLAQPSTGKQTIEQLVNSLSTAYSAKTLRSLDAKKPYFGKITIVIEHSLAQPEYETKTFKTFAKVEKWLKSREIEGFPARGTRKLKQCRKWVCIYDFDGGILHNNLYLKKITYGFSKGRYYIKKITLLDGD